MSWTVRLINKYAVLNVGLNFEYTYCHGRGKTAKLRINNGKQIKTTQTSYIYLFIETYKVLDTILIRKIKPVEVWQNSLFCLDFELYADVLFMYLTFNMN